MTIRTQNAVAIVFPVPILFWPVVLVLVSHIVSYRLSFCMLALIKISPDLTTFRPPFTPRPHFPRDRDLPLISALSNPRMQTPLGISHYSTKVS